MLIDHRRYRQLRGMGAVSDDAREILAAAGAGAGAAARAQTDKAVKAVVSRAQQVVNRVAAGLAPPSQAPAAGLGDWGTVAAIGGGVALLLLLARRR
jgi:hypothetical protein